MIECRRRHQEDLAHIGKVPAFFKCLDKGAKIEVDLGIEERGLLDEAVVVGNEKLDFRNDHCDER